MLTKVCSTDIIEKPYFVYILNQDRKMSNEEVRSGRDISSLKDELAQNSENNGEVSAQSLLVNCQLKCSQGTSDESWTTHGTINTSTSIDNMDLLSTARDPKFDCTLSYDQKKKLLSHTYKNGVAQSFTKHDHKIISEIVSNHVVHKVKFVHNEFLRNLSREKKF